jgi:hypothetical protein
VYWKAVNNETIDKIFACELERIQANAQIELKILLVTKELIENNPEMFTEEAGVKLPVADTNRLFCEVYEGVKTLCDMYYNQILHDDKSNKKFNIPKICEKWITMIPAQKKGQLPIAALNPQGERIIQQVGTYLQGYVSLSDGTVH